MPLPTEQMRKLVALLGQLGHDNENIRANAGLAATKLLKSHNMQWADVVSAAPTWSEPPPRQQRKHDYDFNGSKPESGFIGDMLSEDEIDMLLDMARQHASGEWETNFVMDMCDRYAKYGARMKLSEKQFRTLRRIAKA